MLTCVGFLVLFQCTPSDAVPAEAGYCDIAKPVYWSARDTRATKEQVDRENRKWKRLCQPAAR